MDGRTYVYERAHLYYDSEERLQRTLHALARMGYRPTVEKSAKRGLRIAVGKRKYVETVKKNRRPGAVPVGRSAGLSYRGSNIYFYFLSV